MSSKRASGSRSRSRSRSIGSGAVSAIAVLLAGCASGPDFRSPAPPAVASYTADGSAPSAATIERADAQRLVAAAVPAEWWKGFGSTALDALIARALDASPTLAAAQATLRQAEQNRLAQHGANLPQVRASLGEQRTNAAAPGQAGDASLDGTNSGVVLAYDLDFAGGARRGLEALAAQVDYQSFQLEAARLDLAANVALAAISQAQLAAQIAATEDIVRAQRELLEIAQARVTAGAASPNDTLALATQLEQLNATLPGLRNRLEQTRHLLALLSGQSPAAAELPSFTLADFALPGELPLSVPSQLVRRRPDIRASEALLHAASAQVGVAVARLYPQLTLRAALGSEALSGASLFGPGALIWSLAGQMAQPVFNLGLRPAARAAEAGLEAADAHYRQTVLQALRNVADVLRTLESDAQAQASLGAADRTAQAALQLLEHQYEFGAASYLQLLQGQQQAQQVRIDLLAVDARRFANSVAWYQAMGG